MTDRQLKKYALTGMLIRLEAEEKRLPFIKDEKMKEHTKREIEQIKKDYNNLVEELRN